jgi:hypothetical protein
MNAPVRPPAVAVDAVKVLIARAEARAQLWYNGELSLHDAVDELWADAERDGLVAKLGAEEVQRILADAFAPLRDDLPRDDESPADDDPPPADDDTFAAACRKADEKQRRKPVDQRLEFLRGLLDDDVSFERAFTEINSARLRNRAAEATVEALMFSLRERGTAALAEPETQRRLAELSSAQVRDVIARLIAVRSPQYPAIDDELLHLLGEQLK